jgi:glycosyltransferase involved in cell wall biosynthesis
MRILHVYKDVYPPVAGGIERHIDCIRRAIPEAQHDVLVCSREPRTRLRETSCGTEVLVGEFGRVLSTPIAATFAYWLARMARGAVVHLHMPQPVAELSCLFARRGAPMIATYHADIFRQRWLLFAYRPLVVRCLRAADVVVTASDALRDKSPLITAAGVTPVVVPYGIDVDRWHQRCVDAEAVARIRDRYGERHVLAVGRLVPYKGFDRLVAVADDLEAPLVIVGDGVSRIDLENQIREGRLEDRVHLAGRVDDETLCAHFAAASVFVLPSWNRAEAFGIVLLEAQAAGLPVVATDVGTGTVEALVPGETGLVVEPHDPRAVVRALNDLLRDPKRAAAMGRAGREWVLRNHSLQSLAHALLPLYTELGRAWASGSLSGRAEIQTTPVS